jgi:tetratricopeptide (TPR) repeat protein
VKRTVQTLVIALAFFLATSPSMLGQTDAAQLQKYQSKYKKRGQVHGIVSSLCYPTVYAEVTQAFSTVGLTINYEEPTLGYILGGRSRGVAGEIVRVWIDPESNDQYRVEIRNERLSQMGLIGLAATKDWSMELLDAISKQLGGHPSIAQLRSAVETNPEAIDARRQLIEAYIAGGLQDDAAEAYRGLLAKYPRSHLDRVKFADLLLSRGQPDQAIEILKQAEGTDPDITVNLARIYIQTERSAAAEELLITLAQNNPADLKARYQLARAAYLAGDLSTAKANFSLVIEQAPQQPFAEQAKLWLGLMETGPLKKPPESKSVIALCELLTKEKLDLLAQHYLESISDSTSAPERNQVALMLVSIYQSQRQYTAIVHLLEPQLEQLNKEKQGELIYALAMAQCGLRNFQPALEYLKQAKKAGYKTPKEIEQALKTYQ